MANLHLLFWLSLFPFTTAWVGANHLAPAPTAVYAFVLLMAGVDSNWQGTFVGLFLIIAVYLGKVRGAKRE